MKYIGDTCAGCYEFRNYVKFIKHKNPIEDPICWSCKSVIPKHIPEEQHTKYLELKYEM